MGIKEVSNFDYESRLIVKHISGSHAYGTNIEDSDTDYRGIIIPPKSYFLGLDRFDQFESKDPDIVYYDLRKFIHLALSGNPNILESLFVDQYLLITEYGQRLLEIRNEFLTKACIRAYMGYAQQQRYRLNVKSAPGSRSEKRMALIEKFGWDTKYGLHLIRLLSTGIDILTKGTLPVKRTDAAFLLDIRNGKYTMEEVLKMADDLTEQLRKSEDTSTLPKIPNYNKVNKLITEIVEDFLEKDKCN